MNAKPAAQAADRFESAEEVRAAHAALLESPEQPGPRDSNPVTRFIERAAATGAVLDNPEDRKQVQGLMDYWTASLLSASRDAEAGSASRVKPAVTVLNPFDADTIRRAAAKADEWLAALPDQDRVTARRVMLRLVRLQTDSQRFDPVSTVRGSFYDLDDPKRVNAVIDGLAKAGVVRVTPGDVPELDRVALRSPKLIKEWAAYAGWLADRRKFRDAVVAWDRAGRRASALLSGDQLEEAKSYFDRDGLEREFIEQSRRLEWRINERNRILKWVFGGLAVVALIGWTFALVSLFRAMKDRHTLKEKQQLTNIRLFVRGLGELTAAHTPPEKVIAQARWKALVSQFNNDRQGAAPLFDLHLDEIEGCATCPGGPKWPSADFLDRVRQLRNPLLKNEQLSLTLSAMREVSFSMVKLSTTKAVETLQRGEGYIAVEPYAREFWTQSSGEMLLVEGKQVEAAMDDFGDSLKAIRDEAEKPDPFEKQISNLAAKFPGAKGKQAARKLTKLRLNANTFAQWDTLATNYLDAKDRQSVLESISWIQKQASSRSLSKKLVNDLGQKKDRLHKALDAEQARPTIPPYPDGPAKQ
jgi:hypothetical protein